MIIELESPTAQAVYEAVKHLPILERIKLAGLLISDVSARDVVDTRDTWTDEDLEDFSNASFALIDQRIEEEDAAR
ncbi:MAG TPA: hypothetical protein VF627_04605 [Abditibacterium sp.]|jgi:hypothetical protein